MQQHGRKYFACRPLRPDPVVRIKKVKISHFQSIGPLHIKLMAIPNEADGRNIVEIVQISLLFIQLTTEN